MSHFISPKSVVNYLSGIQATLESFYPGVREARRSDLVKKTVAGCIKQFSKPPNRARALTAEDLHLAYLMLASSSTYDDMLFLAVLFTGINGLHRLGELCNPDDVRLRDYRKRIARGSLVFPQPGQYEYTMNFQKSDHLWEGDTVLIATKLGGIDPWPLFSKYLAARDAKFPLHYELFLRDDGSPPTKSWCLSRMRHFFGSDIRGHAIRSGGATLLALAGVPQHVIQKMGRWASKTFEIYIQKHPYILHALLAASSQAGLQQERARP